MLARANFTDVGGTFMKEYKKRIADELIKKKLKGKGAVLVEGPKWCAVQKCAIYVKTG